MSAGTYVLGFVIVLSFVLTIYYSITSRSQNDFVSFKFRQSKMNIFMGVGLLGLAFMQWTHTDVDLIRLIIGLLFFLVGSFNITAGINYYRMYKAKVRDNQEG